MRSMQEPVLSYHDGITDPIVLYWDNIVNFVEFGFVTNCTVTGMLQYLNICVQFFDLALFALQHLLLHIFGLQN